VTQQVLHRHVHVSQLVSGLCMLLLLVMAVGLVVWRKRAIIHYASVSFRVLMVAGAMLVA
jgi:hypothetical protein